MITFRLIAVGVLLAVACPAASINMGVFSYNTLIPGLPGLPGVNVFSINNLTGDPSTGGFSLAPDFPVLTDTLFKNASITIFTAGPSFTISVGNLGPGAYTPADLEVSDLTAITSATFTATLDPAFLRLADGNVVKIDARNIFVPILPSAGKFLTPDVEFALISAEPQPSAVPEPYMGVGVVCGLLILASLHSRSKI